MALKAVGHVLSRLIEERTTRATTVSTFKENPSKLQLLRRLNQTTQPRLELVLSEHMRSMCKAPIVSPSSHVQNIRVKDQ